MKNISQKHFSIYIATVFKLPEKSPSLVLAQGFLQAFKLLEPPSQNKPIRYCDFIPQPSVPAVLCAHGPSGNCQLFSEKTSAVCPLPSFYPPYIVHQKSELWQVWSQIVFICHDSRRSQISQANEWFMQAFHLQNSGMFFNQCYLNRESDNEFKICTSPMEFILTMENTFKLSVMSPHCVGGIGT